MVVISRSDITNKMATLLAYNGSKRKGNSVNDPPFQSPNDGCPKEKLYHKKIHKVHTQKCVLLVAYALLKYAQ
jgi:hypothetical protein